MKSFIFKINEDGTADFMDKQDKAAYKRLLSTIKNSGRDKFKITVELLDKSKATENQKNLLKVLYAMIADESGNDFYTVKQTLVTNLIPSLDDDSLSQEDFQNYLDKIIVFSNEFFKLNVDFDKDTNHINIKKIR